LTEAEAFACEVHPPSARRLVRIHDRRSGAVRGTAAWLVRLPSFMHHHVALEDQVDIDSLIRFLSGRAMDSSPRVAQLRNGACRYLQGVS